MTTETGILVGIVIQIVAFAFGYGSLRQRVESLQSIVCNGLTDKVNRIDKTVAVIREHCKIAHEADYMP